MAEFEIQGNIYHELEKSIILRQFIQSTNSYYDYFIFISIIKCVCEEWWSIVPFCTKLKCIEVSNIRSLLLSDSLRIYLVYTWNMCYYDGVAFGTENLLTTKYHTFSIGHFFRQFSLHYSRLTSKEGVKSFECWYFVLIFECQKIYLQRICYHDY